MKKLIKNLIAKQIQHKDQNNNYKELYLAKTAKAL